MEVIRDGHKIIGEERVEVRVRSESGIVSNSAKDLVPLHRRGRVRRKMVVYEGGLNLLLGERRIPIAS